MEGNHKDRNHALLSASGAIRWMNCNPSARLEDMFPDCSSEYAEEGTLAHEISELKLTKYLKPMSLRTFNSKMKKLKSHKLYKPEMENYTDVYVDNIKELLMSFDKPGTAEIEKKVDFSEYVPEGFGTCDFVTVDNGTLYIRDLKYGKGVPVSAQDNPQLMLYSLGAYLEFSLFNDIENINMGIIQPRLDIVSIFEISADELMKWAENEVKPNAEKAFKGEGDFKVGQCTFCRAKALCRARAEANMSLETEMKLKGNILSNEEMEVLKEKGVAEELMYERKVLTLTQLEGVVGKKDFNEYVGDFIIKPKGKPTLVPESDKRAPYINDVINASDDFINLDNNGKDD